MTAGSVFHKLGIPSTPVSLALDDYVPALCTHRPSLLPIERFSELCRRSICIAIVVEVERTWSLRGSKSRNKVSVGEPAGGSLLEVGEAVAEVPVAAVEVPVAAVDVPVRKCVSCTRNS